MDMTVPRANFEVVRGDDVSLSYEYLDTLDQSPIDLTGYTVTFPIKRGNQTVNPQVTLDGPNGKIFVHIDHSITESWSSDASYKLRVVTPDNEKTTLVVGDIKVVQ